MLYRLFLSEEKIMNLRSRLVLYTYYEIWKIIKEHQCDVYLDEVHAIRQKKIIRKKIKTMSTKKNKLIIEKLKMNNITYVNNIAIRIIKLALDNNIN